MKHASKVRSHLPKVLVVGVDASGLSDHAVEASLYLGERLDARVDLVHAVPVPPEPWPDMDVARSDALTTTLLSAAQDRVWSRVDSIQSRMAEGAPASRAQTDRGSTVATTPAQTGVRIVPGQPAKVLLDRVRGKTSSWIVLGEHRRREILDFGSTLRAVFAKATGSVWVQAHPFRRIERILAPVDLSKESLVALDLARSLARVFGARVDVLHISSLDYGASADFDGHGVGMRMRIDDVLRFERSRFEQTVQHFDWSGVDHGAEFVEGVPAESIVRRSRGFDLVVLGTHGRTGLASVVLGGTAYEVLKRSATAVLAVRHSQRSFLV